MSVPILKMVHPDMSSDHDRTFVYPSSGLVVARGRHGLHGYAYAIGERGYVAARMHAGMTWLVLMASSVESINRWAKAEFPHAEVVGIYPNALDDALRHIARITRDWAEPGAAAALDETLPAYRWAVARVHRPASQAAAYVRSLGPAPLDAWNALMADINELHATPAAAPAIDDVDAAHRAAQLALAERIQRQRKAARQRLREEHRAIAVDWFVPTPIEVHR